MESHVHTLAHAQAALGLDVTVACINHEAGPTAVEQDGPVDVLRLRKVGTLAKFDFCPDLARHLTRVDADVLHVHVPNPTMLLGLLHARLRKPVVVTYHSDVIRQRVLGALFRPVERLAYRQVRAVLTTSPLYPGGSPFLRLYGDRLHVLPHGIDLAPYLEPSPEARTEAERIRAEHGRGGPVWVGAGRHVYYKGFVHAIRALTRVPGRLVLVGDGPDRPALQAEAERLGLSDRVVFPGVLRHYLDLVPYYLAADAFWFPSNARSEAFGLVQVEAMACGCPVINTAIPHSGVAWVSLHEQTGLTVPVDDPVALAGAAQRLLDEPGLRERLAEGARRRAVEEFDHRVMAQRSVEVYDRVLREQPVPSLVRPARLLPSHWL
jgi:rhamnosyl/mannosyltransferase